LKILIDEKVVSCL